VFGFVATEQQQVGNAKELKIDEHIFCFFACEAAATEAVGTFSRTLPDTLDTEPVRFPLFCVP
jgi:hypothetical protein